MKNLVVAMLGVILALSPALGSDLLDGLVCYWPFDGDAKDYSGNGNHGVTHGTNLTTDRKENHNFAYYFNGSSWIEIANNSSLNVNEITISAWIKPSEWFTNSAEQRFISIIQKGLKINQYDFQFEDSGLVHLDYANGLYANCSGISIGQWQFVAITYDGQQLKAYRNGSVIASKNIKGTLLSGNDSLLIGKDPVGKLEYLIGALDEIAVYNRALSSSEITALYNDGLQVCAVTFVANGGEGDMEAIKILGGKTQVLPLNSFKLEGASFAGWSTSKDGAVEYEDGEEIKVTKDMTLFAVWSRPMTLLAESADWSSGSITLRCEDGDASASVHKYSLEYCSESGEWIAVDGAKDIPATKGQNSAGQEVWIAKLTDTSFSSRLGGLPPVSYRVTDETGRFSAECITRNRFLLSVGYSAFLTGNTPKRGHYNDASEIKYLCVERGEFLSDNAHFRSNASATTEKVRAEMAYFAEYTQPGDLFVFYIATHGGDYDSKRNALLATYDGAYQVKHLLEDVRNFPSSVAVINVIMSCHSFAMTGSVNVRERINLWLAACGFGQCLGNVAWVTSCDAEQSSYTYLDEDHSKFGQSFIVNGFRHGCADMKLYGTEYGGGNTDGVITIGELGRYAQEFFKGLSDDFPSSVQLENEGLLDRIVLGKRTATSSWARPNIPENVNASQGDTKINISWTASGNASSYRIYRYPLDSPSEWKWLGISSGTTFKDGTATLKKEYGYRVKAVNPVGLSDLSTAAVGSRGTSKLIEFLNTVFGITTASADEYDAMEKTPAANGRNTIGECYALGINHEDPNDNLRISHFELQDGKPRLMLNHTEDGSGKSFLSDVRVLGTTALGESPQWDDVTDIANPDASGYRFFKATVELP